MQASVHASHLIYGEFRHKKLLNREIVLQIQLIGEHELSVKHYFSSKMLFLCTVNVKRMYFSYSCCTLN